MMSIRSLADFNGAPLGGAVTGWHRHRHRPGPTLRVDTTNEGWGLLPGHQRGPTPGHQRGLSHGHGQSPTPCWQQHNDYERDVASAGAGGLAIPEPLETAFPSDGTAAVGRHA